MYRLIAYDLALVKHFVQPHTTLTIASIQPANVRTENKANQKSFASEVDSGSEHRILFC